MSKDFPLPDSENMWEHLNEYALMEVNHEGQVGYVICHMPSRTLLIIEDDAEYEATIARMLQLKVQVVDDI